MSNNAQLHKYGYLFSSLIDEPDAHLPSGAEAPKVIKYLKQLAKHMVQWPVKSYGSIDSTIPTVYTYWGQFIAHDITNGTGDTVEQNPKISIESECFEPLKPRAISKVLKNKMLPFLNLDSVYGTGPSDDKIGIYEEDHINLRVGTNKRSAPKNLTDPELGMERDLPRKDRTPVIGEPLNDRNLILAQFHLAILKFHNEVVQWLMHNKKVAKENLFDEAQKLTRWHFQWLVVNDYLKTLTSAQTVERLLFSEDALFTDKIFMPLEFSAAVFRFSHSMIRPKYDYNRIFGREGSDNVELKRSAELDKLFIFTERGNLGNEDSLPYEWVIDWSRFVDKHSPFPERFALKIDTHLATEILEAQERSFTPVRSGNMPTKMHGPLHTLATRDLLRGYRFNLPTGQAVAQELGYHMLTPKDFLYSKEHHNTSQTLIESGFLTNTPLWYYILKEAELQRNGNALGDVGSHIVAGTLIGLLKADCTSYIRNNDWNPSRGVRFENGDPILRIIDFFRFAKVAS